MMRTSFLVFASLLVACDSKKDAPPTEQKPPRPEVSVAATGSVMPPLTAPPAASAIDPKKIVCAAGNEVVVSQPGLEAELRRKSGKDAGPLTKSDLASIKSVNATTPGIPVNFLDPCVFPLLTNVKDIFLGEGKLTDLSPISTLNQLMSLRATNNQVRDLAPLAHLSHMDRLDLSHTQVTELGVVASMSDLTELQLDDTLVGDLTPLSKLKKLEKLSIKNTAVKDLAPLAGIKTLKMLWIAGAPIENGNVLQPLVGRGLKIMRQ